MSETSSLSALLLAEHARQYQFGSFVIERKNEGWRLLSDGNGWGGEPCFVYCEDMQSGYRWAGVTGQRFFVKEEIVFRSIQDALLEIEKIKANPEGQRYD